ncbi:unnamed protein product [Didymodactylos carnosus]|uniref:Integrase catalytic domain-containing protein n=1 Tax=Didymodactylos carnosus TaxID=1234261 RepID=A0A8S2FDR7_9BILA|nr:unnamed protein product [Didymodactylos carnosus]CAF4231391.1 unnamed protein product [Didymodactylos carnosus]
MTNNLLQQVGITHLYSAPNHPQTNGQVERYNSTTDAKIAALSNQRKTDWDEQLPFVTFNYNVTVHSPTKQIPFEMVFGRSPKSPFDRQSEVVSLEQHPEHITKLKQYISSLDSEAKKNIIKTQQQSKKRYDLHESNPVYNLGDLVLVKTINNRRKFDVRHEGPFKIAQRLADKTYIVQHIKKPTLTKQITIDSIIPIFERLNIS